MTTEQIEIFIQATRKLGEYDHKASIDFIKQMNNTFNQNKNANK